MRSRRPIWACCAHPAQRVRGICNNARKIGGRGAHTPPCTYGRRIRRIQMTYHTYMESPVGRLLLEGDDKGLQRVAFTKGKAGQAIPPPDSHPDSLRRPGPLQDAVNQLKAY